MKTVMKTLLAAGVIALATQANAMSISGDVLDQGTLVSGTNLKLNQMQNVDVQLFYEGQKSLSANVAADYVYSGYTSSGIVPAGTTVQSFLVHYDPLTSAVVNASGSMTFDGIILGLITTTSGLLASDSVAGVAGVLYEPGSRALETTGSYADIWSVSGGDLTFNFTPFYTSTGMDEVRVLVAVPEGNGNNVPDGGMSATLLGLGLLAVGMGRKMVK